MQVLQRFLKLACHQYLCQQMKQIQLPQYIIDLVGNLLDEGMDDESICSAAIEAWDNEQRVEAASLAEIC